MRLPFIKEAVSSLFKKPSTEVKPEQKKPVPEGYRGKIKFYPEKCVNCGMCIRVCSPGAITRTIKKLEDGDEVTFEFYMGSCTFCQMCSDFCARKAIELTKEYSMIAENEEDLKVRGTFIKKAPPKPPVPPKPAAPIAQAATAQAGVTPATSTPKPVTPVPAQATEGKSADNVVKPAGAVEEKKQENNQ
jgi:formate hydrogenlyase subunit 6/NADH:ubiquinone oxidoreductase subunit I